MFAILYETTSSTFYVKDRYWPSGQIIYTEQPERTFDSQVDAEDWRAAMQLTDLRIIDLQEVTQ